jgi:hypothetical protein
MRNWYPGQVSGNEYENVGYLKIAPMLSNVSLPEISCNLPIIDSGFHYSTS